MSKDSRFLLKQTYLFVLEQGLYSADENERSTVTSSWAMTSSGVSTDR